MAQVPEKTLSWLYSVLQEYQDPQRAYSDSAQTLSLYPSLSPRTEVYTFEHGASALLLTLSGTLPVAFRGTTYRFPVKIWVPLAYPQESPIVYVTPGKDMAVRPGQHVAVDGRVYHPYLRDWSRMWDRVSIAEFLEYLTEVFSKETPVISRAHQQQYHQRPIGHGQPQAAGASPAIPPQLPPKQPAGSIQPSQQANVTSPPPLPPKPGEEYAEPARQVDNGGPPLPPLPHEVTHQQRASSLSPSSFVHTSRTPSQGSIYPPAGHQNAMSRGPPLPPVPHEQAPYLQQHRANQDRSPVSPISPTNGYSELPGNRYSGPISIPHPRPQQGIPQPLQQHLRRIPQLPQYHQQHVNGQVQPFPAQYYPAQHAPPHQVQQKQATPDLLTDPFDVAIPAPISNLPAPPVPPNPEKEHLLHAMSASLVQQAQQIVNQNLAAIAPLQAQQQALRAAQERLEGEVRQLEHLDQALHNNESILRQSLQDCDHTIATAKSKKQPPIDEVLIAPTMVANQLWILCAEEAACREAMYVLQRANDRGRISGNDFVKQMRGLGRECFLKMALARKCARGMGLDLREM